VRVSLVIPVRDEAATVETLLQSIVRQTRPPDEVVIVDGGSTDDTVARARAFTRNDTRFRVIEAGDATPGRGRNVGITAATHDWIALTDAGIRLDGAWLEQLVAQAERTPGVEIVFGTFDVEVDSRFTRWANLAFVPPSRPVPGGRARGPFIASSLVSRQAWADVGGFPDLRSGEDLLFIRALERRGRVAWAPGARVWWRPPRDLAQTFARFRVYSSSGVRAGLASEWQHGVARYYALAAPFAIAAARRSRAWMSVPAAGLLARAARQCWRHRDDGDASGFGPADVVAVAAITLVTDIAMFVGWAEALLPRPRAAAYRGLEMKAATSSTASSRATSMLN
jgi:glycosyltransferase involved in cell wall biosynthesis